MALWANSDKTYFVAQLIGEPCKPIVSLAASPMEPASKGDKLQDDASNAESLIDVQYHQLSMAGRTSASDN